jgi:NADH-quinone oxidoreductase subunit J
MTGSFLLFAFLAIVAIAAAIGMLLSRNAVYSALFLIINFSSVAVIYLTLGAPFIALAQITVYAGAIMVLFLFVIMLLGAEQLPIRGKAPGWQQGLGIVLGLAVMFEAAYVIIVRSGMNAPLSIPSPDFANPSSIGLTLFNQYLLPFEITSVLLLVAVVGAIVLTKPEKKEKPGRLVSTLVKPAEQPTEKLMEYENQIEAEEVSGDVAEPGGDDMSQRS